MVYDLGYVQGDDNPPPQVVLVEQWRRDLDSVRADHLLDQADHLCEQDLAAAFPPQFHLVEYLDGGLEHDLLVAEYSAKLLQVDLR